MAADINYLRNLSKPTKLPSTRLDFAPRSVTPALQPKPIAATPMQKPMPNQNKTFAEKAFNALAVPSQVVEKYGTKLLSGGKHNRYDTALDAMGVKNTQGKLDINDALSTTARFIADPLNFVAPLKVAKIAGKVPGASQAVGGVARGAQAITKNPIAQAIKNNLGEKFIQGYNLSPKNKFVVDSVKDIPRRFSVAANPKVDELKEIFKDVTPSRGDKVKQFFTGTKNKDAEYVGRVLDVQRSGEDLPALIKEIGDVKYHTVIKPTADKAAALFKNQLDDLVARKRLSPKKRTEFLEKGGYYPHRDFLPDTVDKFLLKTTGIGENRGYLKKTKGKKGYSYDAPKITKDREFIQLYDNAVQDTFKDIKKRVGVKIGKGKKVPEGYVPFIKENGKYREFNGYAIPSGVATFLKGSLDVRENSLTKAIDFFHKWWKPLATSVNPAFHIQNIGGNINNMIIGGTYSPKRLAQAVAGGFTKEEQALVKATGILGRGQIGADITGRGADVASVVGDVNVGKYFKIGQPIEDNARTAFFLDQRAKFLRKGLSEKDATKNAVKAVDKYLFDYQTGLTDFERNTMKRLFPFYTWARFNLPLQVEAILNKPGYGAFFAKLEQELNPEGKPLGDREGITFNTGFKDSQDRQIRIKPSFPIQDIFAAQNRPLEMLSPGIKEAIQLGVYGTTTLAGRPVAPRNLYTGAERFDTDLPLSSQLRELGKQEFRELVRPARSVENIGDDPSLTSTARQLITGTYSYDPAQQALKQVNKKQAVSSAVRRQLDKIQRSSMSPEQKRREREKYLRAL